MAVRSWNRAGAGRILFPALLVVSTGLWGCHQSFRKQSTAGSWSHRQDGSWVFVPPSGPDSGTVPGEYWVIRPAEDAQAQAPGAHTSPAHPHGPAPQYSQPTHQPAPHAHQPAQPASPPAPGTEQPLQPAPPASPGQPSAPQLQLPSGVRTQEPQRSSPPRRSVFARFRTGLKSVLGQPAAESQNYPTPAELYGIEQVPSGGQQPLPLAGAASANGPWEDRFSNPVALGPLKQQSATRRTATTAPSTSTSSAVATQHPAWLESEAPLTSASESATSNTADGISPWPYHVRHSASNVAEQPVPAHDTPAQFPTPADREPQPQFGQPVHRVSSVPPLFVR